MNRFELAIVGYLGEENLKKVQSVKVGIAGCGGLGSNCACNLVRSGFVSFTLVDFDSVEYSNLNRQFYFAHQEGIKKVEALAYNLGKINEDLCIEAREIRLTADNISDIFSDCDIIVEAFDSAECKSMLVENLAPSGKFIVSASGLAGLGNSDEIRVNKINPDLVLVGDLSSDVAGAPPLSPRVNIAAAKQADVVLEYVLNKKEL